MNNINESSHGLKKNEVFLSSWAAAFFLAYTKPKSYTGTERRSLTGSPDGQESRNYNL